MGGFIHSNNCLEDGVGRPTKKRKGEIERWSEKEKSRAGEGRDLVAWPAVVQDDEINK